MSCMMSIHEQTDICVHNRTTLRSRRANSWFILCHEVPHSYRPVHLEVTSQWQTINTSTYMVWNYECLRTDSKSKIRSQRKFAWYNVILFYAAKNMDNCTRRTFFNHQIQVSVASPKGNDFYASLHLQSTGNPPLQFSIIFTTWSQIFDQDTLWWNWRQPVCPCLKLSPSRAEVVASGACAGRWCECSKDIRGSCSGSGSGSMWR
jgi:hypothetical protein